MINIETIMKKLECWHCLFKTVKNIVSISLNKIFTNQLIFLIFRLKLDSNSSYFMDIFQFEFVVWIRIVTTKLIISYPDYIEKINLYQKSQFKLKKNRNWSNSFDFFDISQLFQSFNWLFHSLYQLTLIKIISKLQSLMRSGRWNLNRNEINDQIWPAWNRWFDSRGLIAFAYC